MVVSSFISRLQRSWFAKNTSRNKPARNDVDLALAIFFCLAFGFVFSLLHFYAFKSHGMYNPSVFVKEVISGITFDQVLPEVRPQQDAFFLVILFLLMAISLYVFGSGSKILIIENIMKIPSVTVSLARRSALFFLLGAIIIWMVEVRRAPNFDGAQGLFYRVASTYFDVALLAIFAVPPITKWAGRRFEITIGGLALAACLVISSIGIFQSVDLSSKPYYIYSQIQWHFSFVMGVADILGNNRSVWTDAIPYYGVLFSAIVGIYIKYIKYLEFADFFRIVQFMQVAMLLMMPATLAILYRSPERFLSRFALPTSFVVPFLYTSASIDWYPNQTAWRLIGFAAAAFAIASVQKMNINKAAFVLGVLAGFEFATSLEIGIATAAGLTAAVALSGARKDVFKLIALFVGSALLCYIGLSCLFVIIFRHSPFFSSMDELRDLYVVLGSSWSGFELHDIDLIAIVIFVYSCAIVVASARRWRQGSLPTIMRFQASISLIIIVWFSYYVKRPHSLNLWSEEYLFAFILPSLLDFRRVGLVWGTSLAGIGGYAIAPFLFTALLMQSWGTMLSDIKSSVARPVAPNAEKLSGVWTSHDVADGIRDQLGELQALTPNHSLVYLADNSFVLPILSGVYPNIPGRSAFFTATSVYQLNRLVARLKSSAPDYILFDDMRPDGQAPWGGDHVRRFYKLVAESLSNEYQLTSKTHGWLIFSKRAPP